MPKYTSAGAERYGDEVALARWRERVIAALKKTEGNRRKAAVELGVGLRTLMRWLGEDEHIRINVPRGHHDGREGNGYLIVLNGHTRRVDDLTRGEAIQALKNAIDIIERVDDGGLAVVGSVNEWREHGRSTCPAD
ncbi:MAG: hypothetical protein PVSMB8_00280 [Vulcanimicrobiaceae bacterium]